MKLAESENKQWVTFKSENKDEAKFLRTFPGLLVKGTSRACVAKPNVVYNLASRLPKTTRSNLGVTKFVRGLLDNKSELKPLPDWFEYHTQPYKHQDLALRYCYTRGHLGLLLDPGLGKTKITLDFIYLMQLKKSIIVCPKALLFVWEEEAQVHRPELTTYTLTSTDWESQRQDIEAADIVVMNYAKAVILEEEILKLKPDFINLDEALIKDYKSKRTQAMLRLSKRIRVKGLCSGTLINNTIEDLYAPVKFLEPSLVGNTIQAFRKRFIKVKFVEKKDGSGYIPIAPRDQNLSEARGILDACCIVMSKDEWLDLPPKKFFDSIVSLSPEQKRVYRELASNYITRYQGYVIEVSNPLSLMTKLAQVSSGFIYADENAQDIDELFAEDKPHKKVKRKILYFEDNPKKDDLERHLDDDLKDRKMILWYNMEGEYQILSSLLDSKSISYTTIKGGEKKTGEKVTEFNNTSSIQVLLAQAKTVNYGITVLGMTPERAEKLNRAIPDLSESVYTHYFFGLGFSLEVYLQQQDRSHRIGVVTSPEYYRGLTNSPAEMRTVDALDNKQELRQSVLVDIIKSIDLEKAFT